MKRRNLLINGLFGIFALTTSNKAEAKSETAIIEVDSRPRFKLNDFNLVGPRQGILCPVCNVDHIVYTRGCHPVAFTKNFVWNDVSYIILDATKDSVPCDLPCPADKAYSEGSRRFHSPHTHNDFVWIDD